LATEGSGVVSREGGYAMGSKEKKSADTHSVAAKRFAQLTLFGKIKHVGKIIVFLASFGFAFPNIFSD
jgi:hypothetical protein